MTIRVQKSRASSSRSPLNIMIVLGIVAVVLAATLVSSAFGQNASARTAVVTDADGKTYELPLSTDAELAVESSAGENVIVVSSGEVWVKDADCPNLDCVHQGKISQVGQQIICLPHKLAVSVRDAGASAGSQQTYDVVGS